VNFEELTKRGMQVPHGNIFIKTKKKFFFQIFFLVQFFGPISQGNFLYNLGLNNRITVRDNSFNNIYLNQYF